MKLCTIIAGVTACALGTVGTIAVHAQSPGAWYVGVGAGATTLRFEPQYTLIANPSERFAAFDNTTNAVSVELLAGGDLVSRGRFRLALDGGVSATGAAWTFALDDEPAQFRYRMPWTALLTVRPAVQLTDRARLFAAAGLGAGRVQERKQSPSADRSSYDDQRTNGVVTVGGGAELAVAAGFALRAEYRYVQHNRYEYETRLPSGTRVERVSDTPSFSGVVVTLLRSWSRSPN